MVNSLVHGMQRRPADSLFAVVAVAVALFCLSSAAQQEPPAAAIAPAAPGASTPTGLVLVEAAVMSLCPDARFCEAALEPVFAAVGGIAELRLIHLGGADACLHGPTECQGNALQACVQAHAPRSALLPAVLCSNARGRPFDPDVVAACLREARVPEQAVAAVAACAAAGGDSEGARLLAAAEAARRGIAKSCTLLIAGTKRCVRDGFRWYDCPGGSETADFVRDICRAWTDAGGGRGGGEDVPAACSAAAAAAAGGGVAGAPGGGGSGSSSSGAMAAARWQGWRAAAMWGVAAMAAAAAVAGAVTAF